MSKGDGFFERLAEILKEKLNEVFADTPPSRLATYPQCSRQLYGPETDHGDNANPFKRIQQEINDTYNMSLMACTSYDSGCAHRGDFNLCEAILPQVCGTGPTCDGYSCGQSGASCAGGTQGFSCPAADISCDLFKCPSTVGFHCIGRFAGCNDVYWEGGDDCPSTQRPFQCDAPGSNFQCANDNDAFRSCTNDVSHFGCPSGYDDCSAQIPYMSCPGVFSCIGRYLGSGNGSHCTPYASFHCPNEHQCDTFLCSDHFICARPMGSFECTQNYQPCPNYPYLFDCTADYREP